MSASLLLGLGAAIVASSLYSVGIALQALDAREVPVAHGLRLSLVGQLVRRRRWLAGTGVAVAGWPFQVAALLLAPLVVVQPALAMGLLVLLVLGTRMLGEHAGPRERVAMGAIVVGVAGLAWSAPERSAVHAGAPTLALILGGLWLAVLAPYALGKIGIRSPTLAMLGAGLGFAWGGIATKLVADAVSGGHWWPALAWAVASTATEAIGLLSEMSALQTRPAIQVAPVVFVVQTVVPVLVAPALVHESLTSGPLGGGALLAALIVLAVGAASLARSPALATLMAGARDREDSGSAPSLSEPSLAVKRSSEATEVPDPSRVTTTTSPARSER